jgi:uncharacterized repeat protein (TIGR01451 family)
MITRPFVRPRPRRAVLALLASSLGLAGLAGLAPGLAQATPTGYLQLTTSQAPTNLPPNSKGTLLVMATNLGDAPISGEIVLTDKLPAGLTALAVTGSTASLPNEGLMQCMLKSSHEVSCAWKGAPRAPLTGLTMHIKVQVGSAVAAKNRVEASGAANAASEQPVVVEPEAAPFSVEKYTFIPEEEGGAEDRKAGSHPFQLTTTLGLSQTAKEEPVALARNLQFTLPPGLIGNPSATKQCSQADFNTILPGDLNLCGPDTVVGEAQVTIEEPNTFHGGPAARTVPIFNLEPALGEPARFGLLVLKDPVVLETAVRTGNDYAVVVIAKSSSELAGLISSTVSFWGYPADPRHSSDRGWACVAHGEIVNGNYSICEAQMKHEQEKPPPIKPFLSMPTSCGTSLASSVVAESWLPGAPTAKPVGFEGSSMEGCESLKLNPTIEVMPDSSSASTPTGLSVTVAAPQQESEGPGAEKLVESALRSTTVALPEGLQLSPAAAGGLLACSALQVGFTGTEERLQTNNSAFSADAVSCPEQAKVGTVEIISPDLSKEVTPSAAHPDGIEPDPLKGFVYLASQDTNPFEAPLVLYLVAQDPVSGVLVKLAGTVTPDPVTGRLTSTFENTPQVPFNSFKLHFFDGPRASQGTPARCGSYTTASSFTPWSGGAASTPSSSFAIEHGPGGGPCPTGATLPFNPALAAGSTNGQAGAFSNFSLTIGHADGDQALSGLTMKLPNGMAAMLSSVTPCPEPQAANNQCGPASLVGHSISSSGLGGEPFNLPGQVFLTGPYKGAPFGLSVVTPAVAGPFNLGFVTVRSTINVDPSSAAVTVASDPFPTIIRGVPVQLKQINVQVDRPGFQFNPTSCERMAVAGTITGAEGGAAAVSSPFQVANCAALPFGPKLTATVGAQASKANGVSFNVLVESKGLGQANIHKVELQIPESLPSRLTTIQKACRDTSFNVNPASCPEGSLIGKATIHTPVLKNPLTGPAYLVSHGNAAFPDVEFVLQGEGITLVLDGKTDIKKGITYSRFESAPDAPFTTFITELPAGPHSALGAFVAESKNYNLCGANLAMPTVITAQNGTVLKQVTNIEPLPCHGVESFQEKRAKALAKALKVCRTKYKKNKKKRTLCEKQARKKYGPVTHKKTKAKTKAKKKK